MVLASRTDPPLALARLRAHSQLAELRAADLRVTADEAGGCWPRGGMAERGVAGGGGGSAGGTDQGWAAGLQLAALSLRGQSDMAGFVAAFTGSHRYVLDFLAEEVLERQTGQVLTFLLETSVLERLSGPLCNAVTGREGSQALLEHAEAAGLFLVPLDAVRGWWRYHHLFADLLRARLQAEQPARVAQLHRNAAAWCADHGLADDAIRHAVAAGEMAWAAGLVEQHFDGLVYLHGEDATIQRWISALPGELVRSRPRLLLAQSFLASYSGQLEAVEPLLDAAERASPGWADEPFEPSVGRARSLLVNIPALIALRRGFLAQLRGDAEATVAFASQAMAESGEDEWLLGLVAQSSLAAGEWLRGRVAAAESVFVACIPGWRELGQPTLTAWVVYQLGQVQRAQGRLDAAVETFQRTLHAATAPGRESAPTLGLVYVGLAEVAYQRNELDSALRYVTEGIALCRLFVYGAPLATAWRRWRGSGRPPVTLPGHGRQSRKRASSRRARPARSTRSQRSGHGYCWPGAIWPGPRAGRGSAASARMTSRTIPEKRNISCWPACCSPGRPGQALALLGRLHEVAAAQDRVGSLIEIGALRALALAASGEEDVAVAALAGALTIVCPQGYVRVFADEGPPMAVLLGGLSRPSAAAGPLPRSRWTAWPGCSVPSPPGPSCPITGPTPPSRGRASSTR